MKTIDSYIERIETFLDGTNCEDGEKLLEEIFFVFKNEIPSIRTGTSFQAALDNMVFNLNDLPNPLPETYDLYSDLKLVLNKIKLFKDSKNDNETVINNTTVNIANSKVAKSVIASKLKNERENNKGKILTTVAAIATIIGTIIAILAACGIFNK